MSTLTLNEKIENLTSTWITAFDLYMPSKKAMKLRLEELTTWDTCNGHELERQAKINALNFLINKK